jgi:alkylhydroperoxidase family enzyme
MAHIDGDPRALHPGVAQTYDYIRDNVLDSGLVDQSLKALCFRYVAQDEEVMDLDRFEGRERLALEWAHAIVWDADQADDALWERLHEHFSEPELVELGCAIGFELGQQHFLKTLGIS